MPAEKDLGEEAKRSLTSSDIDESDVKSPDDVDFIRKCTWTWNAGFVVVTKKLYARDLFHQANQIALLAPKQQSIPHGGKYVSVIIAVFTKFRVSVQSLGS